MTFSLELTTMLAIVAGVLVWLIRLEAKVLANEKKFAENEKKEENKDKKDHADRLTIWKKLDEIGNENKEILKSLTRVETKIEYVTKE